MKDQKRSIEERLKKTMTPIEVWMYDNWGIEIDDKSPEKKTSYDKLLEMAVESYSLLAEKTRKLEIKDQQQYLCTWWFENKLFFRKYNSYASVGELLGGKDHATIMHTIKHRKKSNDYEVNVACIKDFLES